MTFTGTDGDAWYHRNKDKMGQGKDFVMSTIDFAAIELAGKQVLEVGCSDGWRLEQLQERGAVTYGMEPSFAARMAGNSAIYAGFIQQPGGFRSMVPDMDVVIIGFCLYLVDPDSLFQAVTNVDDILKDGGHLVIHDFLPESPCSRVYEHNPSLMSRKMNHAKLWLAHPAYRLLHAHVEELDDGAIAHVSILQKNMSGAFPLEETNG